jgi:thioredoxin reductase
MKVAVIGAGAAGLVSARELMREGHDVCVFEQSAQVGGTWVYDAGTEDDPLGLQPSRPVHSSMYDSLRTNLPRDLMAFMDYSFDSAGGGDNRWERYPHHSLVLQYLRSFARDFNIQRQIEFNQCVTHLEPVQNDQWRIRTSSGIDRYFDSVSVCNGHYSQPYVPDIQGAENFKGTFLHSHNYRNPSIFAGQAVAVLGAASSGFDVAHEVATTAKRVIWCGEDFRSPAEPVNQGLSKNSIPSGFNQQGGLVFEDAPPIEVDSFIFCTGYRYEFPFLESIIVQVADNQVTPLHMDLVHPAYPTLGFIGLPYVVIPFPLFEVQARWFARLLSGSHTLPRVSAMMNVLGTRQHEQTQGDKKVRHYHRLAEGQFGYINNLALQCGSEPLPDWYELLAKEAQQVRINDPEHFRSIPLRYSGTTIVQ